MRISACVIVKNEERNIARCISSYIDIVDEIVVVDTGSTDRTVEIAKDLGAKVFYFEWVNDFAKAKNYALSKATGDWIIFLDADEYFDVERSRNIPNLIKKYGKDKTKILGCTLVNIEEKTGEIIGTCSQSRIFKRDKEIYYISDIHERLHSEGKDTRAVFLTEEELLIYHTGYSQHKIQEKAERNLPMLLKGLEREPVDPTLYFFLSDTYFSLKDYEKCIYYGELFLKNRVNMTGLNSKVYQNIIAAKLKLKLNQKDIESFIEKALAEFPEHPMFYMLLGELFFSKKQYEKALENYKKALEKNNNYKNIEINNLAGRNYEIEKTIALILEIKNKKKEALDYYISALVRKKDYHVALDRLLKLCKKESETEVINILEKIYDRNNFEQLSFLIERLVKQRYKLALAYYVNLMLKQFNHQDFSIVIMFLTNEKYQQAFKHFYEAYITNFEDIYAKLAIVTGYLNDSEEMLLKIRDVVIKPSYRRIIEAILSNNPESVLLQEDLNDYLKILTEIIKIGKENYIDKFIDLKHKFEENSGEISIAIGNILKENGYYRKALEQYAKQEIGETHRKFFAMGYCYFKLENLEQALICFEKALENGYPVDEIEVFLQWINEQLSDKDTKNYCKVIDMQILNS